MPKRISVGITRKEAKVVPIFGNGAGKGSTPFALARIQGNNCRFLRGYRSRLWRHMIIDIAISSIRKKRPPMREPMIIAMVGFLCEFAVAVGAAGGVGELDVLEDDREGGFVEFWT